MGYRRETRDIVEETIKKLALDIQKDIENENPWRNGAIANKANALANLVRVYVEVPNASKGAVSSSSMQATASEIRFSASTERE